ncbi:hypothetical protein GMA11_02320 [Granulicatella sp. zg-ZJ]|uniref:hypothetical protein n=1 Tax=Granulicatella sp. zg-ZJ TaxID=2678504 RepID=UPI0013D88FFD|nr:hypothetical protein [Granulicatella sp. zg-ZJ]NEW62222.1 hypothetical protein [Granulicatella sp. zg-ZJ]
MFEHFVKMETFMYETMPFLICIMSAVLLIWIPCLIYIREKRWAKYLNLVTLLFLIGTSVYIYTDFKTYEEISKKEKYVNAAVREYKLLLFSGEAYSYPELKQASQEYMKDTFENIGLYDANTVEEVVEYLGKDDLFYYFDIAGQQLSVTHHYGAIDDNIQEAKREGIQYTLTDKNFENIGFINQSSIFFIKYHIPKSMEDKIVEKEVETTAKYQKKVVKKWIIP